MHSEFNMMKHTKTVFIAGVLLLIVYLFVLSFFFEKQRLSYHLWILLPSLIVMGFLGYAGLALMKNRGNEDNHQTEDVAVLKGLVSDGIIELNEELRIVGFNLAAEELTGWKAEYVLNKKCFDVFQGVDGEGKKICTPETCRLAECFCRNGAPPEYEMEVTLKDGVTRYFHFHSVICRKDEKKSAIMVIKDISKSKEFDVLRQDFIDSVSHELRTPITTIKAYATTMRHPKANFDKATIDNYLHIISGESDRLANIIENILKASKFSSDKLILNIKAISIDPLFEEAVKKVASISSKHTVTLMVKSHPRVFADVEQIRYVFEHLLANAVKFSPDGGTISVQMEEDQKDVVAISIEDQGIGIPFNQQKKIFETFHKIDIGTTKKIYSVGMGLFIVKKIIEAHGGIIWVESTPGEGSRFTFTLQRVKDAPQQVAEDTEKE